MVAVPSNSVTPSKSMTTRAWIAHRAGHARSSMTLDVYAHVLVGDRDVDRAAVLS
jgi:hypothetical protein